MSKMSHTTSGLASTVFNTTTHELLPSPSTGFINRFVLIFKLNVKTGESPAGDFYLVGEIGSGSWGGVASWCGGRLSHHVRRRAESLERRRWSRRRDGVTNGRATRARSPKTPTQGHQHLTTVVKVKQPR